MKLHWYYKFLIIFLVFFSMFFLLTENMSSVVNNSIYKNYMNFISIPFNFLDKYNILEYKKVLDNNQKLEQEVFYLKNSKEKVNNLREENNKLKKLVKLEKLYTDYDIVYCATLNRNKMYWYSRITINKGSNDNIKIGEAVISTYGLIGIVESVTKDNAVVQLITNNRNSNKISVGINKGVNYKHGIISNYNYPYLEVELTDSISNIVIGDKVTTSGLGNLPKNIAIGEVEKIKKDRYGLVDILYVKPYQDMGDINYIGVLIK